MEDWAEIVTAASQRSGQHRNNVDLPVVYRLRTTTGSTQCKRCVCFDLEERDTQLFENGLLSPSFVPQADIRRLWMLTH